MKTSLFLLSLILGCVTATPAWMNAAGIDSDELEDPYDAEIEELEEDNETNEEILEEMEGAMQSVYRTIRKRCT